MLSNAELRQRDGDRCARCGSTLSLDVHHRRLRSHGGSNEASNLITLCRKCHTWVHAHPFTASADGWLVTEGRAPAEVPLRHWMWPGGPVLMLDDGGFGFFCAPDEIS